MIQVRLYDHPFGNLVPQKFEAVSIGQWLVNRYGQTPKVTVQVFAGEPSAATEITGDIQALMANDHPEYVVLESPGGPVLQVIQIILIIFSVFSALTAEKPQLQQMPANVNRTQQSPNNALGVRENQARVLQRVEDIYGTVRAVPSLMMPTYVKYINHQQYEYGYYCIGRGYYDIDELRDGDTLISDIGGASAAVYDPFQSPNSGDTPVIQIGSDITDLIVTAARAIEVDGITLKAPNQIDLPASAIYTFTPDAGGDIITQAESTPGFSSFIVAGDFISVTTGSFDETSNDGYDYDGAPYNPTVVSGPYDYGGTYEVAEVTENSIILTTSTFDIEIELTASIFLVGADGYSDWVTLPDPDRTKIWINVGAPQGLYLDNGGKSLQVVNFIFEVGRLDDDLMPYGSPEEVEEVPGTINGATSDMRAVTIDWTTEWAGPIRVRMKRVTDHDFVSAGTVVDEIKWLDLYSVTPVTATQFGNKTTVHTVTQATPRATAVKTRQLNCLASRMLPTYNGTAFSGAFDSTGLLVSGSINTTSKIVDILAAVTVDSKIGNLPIAESLDIAQVWTVQGMLDDWTEEAGQFNYTFDTDNLSYEETVLTISNAAFCSAYRQNGKIRLAFDRAQDDSTAMFTHRNKKPKSETITRRFASDSEYDGVEFKYVDPDSNQSETIRLPLDDSATKYKSFEIPGIRSFDQAWFRANREYQRLKAQRIMIETTTTLDARSLLPNARIDIVDNTRFESFDGEVVGQSGLTLILSRNVSFVPSESHSIVLMKRDGSLQSIACVAGPSSNMVVLGTLPSEAVVTTGGEDGIRTIFSFAADSVRDAMAYLVQTIDVTDGQYAKILAVNYSAAYYSADDEPIPDKNTIII